MDIFQSLRDPGSIADTLNAMGELLNDVGEYGPAKELLMDSVRIAEQIGNTRLVASNYNALGSISGNQRDFTSAKLWFAKAPEMWDDLHNEKTPPLPAKIWKP